MIELKNVNKNFKGQEVVKNITLEFEEGKIHGITGRNGSGKTVLLKLICGLLKPTNGEVFVRGQQVGKDRDFPENLGVIIETPGFISHQSGYHNLKSLADIKRVIGKEEIKNAMEIVGLDPDLKRHVGKYSLGMRQRLGIAQAIMEKPDILLLDEPMNGLDKEGMADMRKLFLELKEQGKTILLASHAKEDIDILCDNVFEMDKGEITKIS